MKRTFMMLLVLFVIYLVLQIFGKIFSDGHYLEYNITKGEQSFIVKEEYINKKNESNYFIEIAVSGESFFFQTYKDYSKADTIVKDIQYAKIGNYSCMLPLFYGNKAILDITCKDGKLIYNYADLAGKNRDLDNWVNSLSEIYSLANFKDDMTNTESIDKTTIYPSNIEKNHYFAVENYKGIETVNLANFKKHANVAIFEKDQYAKEISGYLGKNYIVAEMSNDNTVAKFIIVDIMENEKNQIESKKNISSDSYIMGGEGNSFYLFDRKNDKQYQINIKTKKIIEVGNREVGIKMYNDGKWDWISFDTVKEDIFFDNEKNQSGEFALIKNVLGENGVTYFYKKVNNGYEVYLSPNRKIEYKKYIFTIENLDKIKYINDYIYFQNKDTVYYYNESRGVRAIYKNAELEFNKTLKFGIYINK